MALRKKLIHRPVWGGTFEHWSRKWVNDNFWRVSHLHGSIEDSLQECALVFSRCLKIYYSNGKVDNDAWFMALYKRAVANEWHQQAVNDTKRRSFLGPSLDEQEYSLNSSHDMGSSNWGELVVFLKNHGLDLLDALASIALAPAELIEVLIHGPTISILRTMLNTKDDTIIAAAAAFLRVRADEDAGAMDEIINDLCNILEL